MAIVLLILPLAFFALTRDAGQMSWVPKPSLRLVYDLFYGLSGESGRLVLSAYVAAVVAALFVLIRGWRSSAAPSETWSYGFVFTGFMVPIVLTLGASLLRPMFTDRFLIVCLPPFLLLVAAGVCQIRPQRMLAAVLLVICGLALRGNFLPQATLHDAQDWRGATAYVLSQSRAGDSVVIDAATDRVAFDFYRERLGQANNVVIAYPPAVDQSVFMPYSQRHPPRSVLESLPRRHQRVWLILSHHDRTVTRANLALLGSEYSQTTENDFIGIEVHLYSKR